MLASAGISGARGGGGDRLGGCEEDAEYVPFAENVVAAADVGAAVVVAFFDAGDRLAEDGACDA